MDSESIYEPQMLAWLLTTAMVTGKAASSLRDQQEAVAVSPAHPDAMSLPVW